MAQERISLNMEYSNQDKARFTQMKQFVSFAREFIATYSEKSLGSMNKCLGLIALSDNISFHPGRLEVSAFYSSLSEVMSHQAGPHWQGVSVLAKAVKDTTARHALVQRYRFMPTLSPLLMDQLNFEKKSNLLLLMEELTYHIKINWQESYLVGLLKKLAEWVLNYDEGNMQRKKVCNLALTVLCNLCYQNLQVTYTLMKTVDTRELIKKVLSLKDDESGGVQVCRLLLILQGVQCAPACHDVHNFITVTLQAFYQGIKNCDVAQLRHSTSFMNDLCSDSQTKSFVISYDKYEAPIQEALKNLPPLLGSCGNNSDSDENICLENTFKFLLTLVKTDLFSLRPFFGTICQFCIKSSHITRCLGSVCNLVGAIVAQFHEDGMLPDELMSVLSSKMVNQHVLRCLLAPTIIDATTCGLQWLQMILSLYECTATQDMVVAYVQIEQFEDILYQILQNSTQTGSIDSPDTRESVLTGCLICLELAQNNSPWDSVFNRMLSNTSIHKVLSYCLSASGNDRKRALNIVKHPWFPADRLSQVFCVESTLEPNATTDFVSSKGNRLSCELSMSATTNSISPVLSPAQEVILDRTIEKFSQALDNNDIEDITASNIMELYRYKICCLEQRLNACTIGLQGATHNVTSLSHSIALLEATNKSQLEIMYRTQCHNEKLKENISRLSDQLSDAEQSIKRFQGKLAAERLDREQQIANTKHKHGQKIKEMQAEIETRDSKLSELNDKLVEIDNNNKNLKNKLNEQINKNSELADVLIKFEERVKQRDKKIEEANTQNVNTKSDLHQAQQTIKSLEKTLLEREKRLTQLTSQLEEMQRIQEIIANLMGNKSSTNSSNNSMS